MTSFTVHPLTAFIGRQLVEYSLIFPTTFQVIDHMFYVLGNGYDFDGVRFRTSSGRVVDNQQMLTGTALRKFIDDINKKREAERTNIGTRLREMMARIRASLEEIAGTDPEAAKRLAELDLLDRNSTPLTITAIPYERASAEMLTLEALRADLGYHTDKRAPDSFVRPYPFSLDGNYGPLAFRIKSQAPQWLKQLCVDMHTVWVDALVSELDTGNYSDRDYYNSKGYLEGMISAFNREIARVKGMM